MVADAASRILGPETTIPQIVDMTLKLSADLIDSGAPPGDLVAGEPGFIPWPGAKEEQLKRVKDAMDKLGRLPHPAEVCWFFNETAYAKRRER